VVLKHAVVGRVTQQGDVVAPGVFHQPAAAARDDLFALLNRRTEARRRGVVGEFGPAFEQGADQYAALLRQGHHFERSLPEIGVQHP
jgi:hypothetical protein